MKIIAGEGYILLGEIEKDNKDLTLVNSSVEKFKSLDEGCEDEYCFCDRRDLRELIIEDKKFYIVKEENVFAFGYEESEKESN